MLNPVTLGVGETLHMDVSISPGPDYELLDAGGGRRLERFGPHVFDRPSPIAIWRRERPELWAQAAGTFERGQSGTGTWDFKRRVAGPWPVRWNGLALEVRPTGFGHMGLFPEHSGHWEWVERLIRSRPAPVRVLHLFAYTGAFTLVAARAGAEVCHVDAVSDVNDWARRNAEASGLASAPVRWIADDAAKFVAREIRRGRKYDGIILDPPSYGRGPAGEKWILEEHLAGLFDLLADVVAERPLFMLFTCHNPGFSPPVMGNMLRPWSARFGGAPEEGNMLVRNPALQCVLPCGFFARWQSPDPAP